MTTADLLEHENGGGTPGEDLIAVGYTVIIISSILNVSNIANRPEWKTASQPVLI